MGDCTSPPPAKRFTKEQQAEAEALLPLANAIASGFRFRRDDEYVSVAHLALCEAVLSFDPSRGVPLVVHVEDRIRAACRRFNQRERGRQSRQTPFCEFDESHNQGSQQSFQLTAAELAAELAAQLSDEVREAATLRWVDELTIKEIAGRLCIGPTTVKRLLTRARAEATRLLRAKGVIE